MIIPPFAGVTLVEYEDRIELTPYFWYREFIGMGRYKADEVGPQPGSNMHPLFNAVMDDREIWVVAVWRRYEDGREEPINMELLDPRATEEEARFQFDGMVDFMDASKKNLEALSECFRPTEEDFAYVEDRFPGGRLGGPDPKSIDEWDLYQGRLKVLAGMQPETVKLIQEAELTSDPEKREVIERQAVRAYIAELAHHWTDDQLEEWLRGNPLGMEWMIKFVRVWKEPKREIDAINHELALNWLRRKYNLLTAEELSDAVLVATGQRLMPGALKKRRERLGLTTKRPPGPPPRENQ